MTKILFIAHLLGIVAAPTSIIEIPSMVARLNQAILARTEANPAETRDELLSMLTDKIIHDDRWVVSDKVTKAAANLVEFLIRERENHLLSRMELALQSISVLVDAGWSERYAIEPVPSDKLARLRKIVAVYNRILRYRSELPPEGFRANFARVGQQLCSIVLSRQGLPQLHF